MGYKYEPEVVYRTIELFLDQKKIRRNASNVAEEVNRELKPARALTRESVYKILEQARSEGLFRLVPPLDRQLKERLERKFPQCFGRVSVVSTHDKAQNHMVADVAGELAVGLIHEIAKKRASHTVGLGLGPGRATLDFCKYLGTRIKSEPLFPKLRLIAISAGCPASLPEYASSSFFHLFPNEQIEERIGLFAESLVREKDLARVKKTPGVHEAFEARLRDSIDVVVTSMGDFSDPHDLLSMFLHDAGMRREDIQKRKWVGNVQYRPYTSSGTVNEGPNDWRAVTLFEIEDLVNMAKLDGKHIILLARQCGICEQTRAKALLPLLTNPSLRIFSKLVLDAATARDLLMLP